MQSYVFQRGETLVLALDAAAGDPAAVTAIRAAMTPVGAGRSRGSGPVVALEVVAADGGWQVMLPAARSAALQPGRYLADARIEVGGAVVVSDPVTIEIVEGVTP